MKLISLLVAVATGMIGITAFRKPYTRLSQEPHRSVVFPPPVGTEIEIRTGGGRWIPATYNGRDEQGYYLCDYHNGYGNYTFEREELRLRLTLVSKEAA